jgi:SAP domain-containing ribonucleoprotein
LLFHLRESDSFGRTHNVRICGLQSSIFQPVTHIDSQNSTVRCTVAELRTELERRGLPVSGNKPDLINRLQARLDEEEFGLIDAPATTINTTMTNLNETGEATGDNPSDSATEREKKGLVPTKTEEMGEESKTDKFISEAHDANNVKVSAQPTFDEIKRRRANRFDIPVVETKVQSPQKRGRDKKKSANLPILQKGSKRARQQASEKDDVLLPKEEIEKRLKRAEKYGTGNEENILKLKAMLRKYRF